MANSKHDKKAIENVISLGDDKKKGLALNCAKVKGLHANITVS